MKWWPNIFKNDKTAYRQGFNVYFKWNSEYKLPIETRVLDPLSLSYVKRIPGS